MFTNHAQDKAGTVCTAALFLCFIGCWFVLDLPFSTSAIVSSLVWLFTYGVSWAIFDARAKDQETRLEIQQVQERYEAAARKRTQEQADAKRRDEQIKAQVAAEMEADRKLVDEHFQKHPTHVEVLLRMKERLVYDDEFGDAVLAPWESALETYLREKIPSLRRERSERIADLAYEVDTVVDQLMITRLNDEMKGESVPPDYGGAHPAEFEVACEKTLRELGFETSRVAGVGDQGADVVAERDGVRVAVQCKLYSGKVGNDAVQQVVAAKAFYKCQMAIVVATGGYTKAARQLAGANGVVLCDGLETLRMTFQEA